MQEQKQGNVWGNNLGSAVEAMEHLGDAISGEMVEVEAELQEEIQLFSEQLDFDTAMQFIIDDRNQSTIDFNEVLDEVESLRKENQVLTTMNELLKTENESMKVTLLEAEVLADKHTSLLDDYNKLVKENVKIGESYTATVTNYELLKGQKATIDSQLKVANTDLASIKKNSAGHKKSNDTLRKQVARLTKEAKEKRTGKNTTSDIPQLNTVYEVNNEVLIVYPQRHKMNNGESLVEQTVLLYSDMRGVYLTVCLDDDNQAVFSSPINIGELSERTIATYRKHSISPSEAVRGYATQWLYRVNVEQKMKVERFDLAKFTGE